ncbi:MAG TPA: class I SAM-dependent methyltransferase [Streptosporangiaceae bacterium]|jgi:ubiquinone/menaquinone biosynthesis C-methylase UbiE|nr:class I SAM-dependent methyltransferase [Streptosporangiaceae bacterium]
MTYTETTVGQTIDRLMSDHPELDPSADGALDSLDQFHIGGPGATGLLIVSLALAGGDRVLDVGSGFGGPARQIARRTGSHVSGIDITPAYVDAARDLTARTGLRDLVEFRVADIATFEPDPLFQAAITMHVQMNVRDKTAWFAHIARCLAPGARLAVWEVCQPRQADLPWPMPWSIDGTDSFVATAGSLRASIEQAGFTASEWTDETAWVQAWITKTFAGGPPAGPALPMLLDDGYTRVINFAAALGDGTLEVWRGAFTRNAS